MSNIDKQALREVAEKAGSDKWQAKKINGDFYVIRNGSYEKQHGFTSYQPIAEIEHKPVRDYVAAANPATVLALLDDLEAKDNRINRLEAIVSVAEQRNALMREWKRALKVPCDLVDNQVPVVIHGMVIRLERLKETETKLEAAEKRIAEQEVEKELFLRTKALMYQSGGTPIENSLNPIDAWLYDAERAAAAGKGE